MLKLAVVTLVLSSAAAFSISATSSLRAHTKLPAATMGLFDGLNSAFANDPTLGKAKSAGLSKEAGKVTVTWVNPKTGAKKTAQCVPGQRLRDVARASGIPIKYDCQEGTCKTCTSSIGKICVLKVPRKDVTIKYNIKG